MAILLGLTGSLGSGKSTVSRMLAEMGALVIDADRLAREAAEPGGEGYGEIVRAFGPAVVRSGGDLDREALARIVFADPARRRELEAILHPLVRRAMRERIQQAPPGRLVVLDVPLLFENGLDGECDATCAVVVDEAVRMERLVHGAPRHRVPLANANAAGGESPPGRLYYRQFRIAGGDSPSSAPVGGYIDNACETRRIF